MNLSTQIPDEEVRTRQVVIYPGEDGYWVAECPDLPGCVSQGKDEQEAAINIREAIQGYIEALEEDDLPFPEERSVKVTCPICAWSHENLHYPFVYETAYWRVVLAPNQSLIGRCVVHLKRHCGDLADQTQSELLEWLVVVRTLEAALRSAFDTTMFNWSCYMNHSYQSTLPEPHIHWWAVPRYNHPVRLGDWVFEDPHFGNPYDHYRWLEVPTEVYLQIAERIRQAILR